MLVSLIMNLQNRGGTPPTPTDEGGDGFYPQPQQGGRSKEQEEMEQRIKRLRQDDEDFIMILSQWVVNNN